MKRNTANKYMSWYILLRDAIELAKRRPGINQDGTFRWCECCTCGKIIDRFDQKSHAGHYEGKGHGGGSGTYYDESNIHSQCDDCNRGLEGNKPAYALFMLNKYGRKMMEDLHIKHKLPRPRGSIEKAGLYYREAYKQLLHEHNLEAERIRRKIGKVKGD